MPDADTLVSRFNELPRGVHSFAGWVSELVRFAEVLTRFDHALFGIDQIRIGTDYHGELGRYHWPVVSGWYLGGEEAICRMWLPVSAFTEHGKNVLQIDMALSHGEHDARAVFERAIDGQKPPGHGNALLSPWLRRQILCFAKSNGIDRISSLALEGVREMWANAGAPVDAPSGWIHFDLHSDLPEEQEKINQQLGLGFAKIQESLDRFNRASNTAYVLDFSTALG